MPGCHVALLRCRIRSEGLVVVLKPLQTAVVQQPSSLNHTNCKVEYYRTAPESRIFTIPAILPSTKNPQHARSRISFPGERAIPCNLQKEEHLRESLERSRSKHIVTCTVISHRGSSIHAHPFGTLSLGQRRVVARADNGELSPRYTPH